MKYFLPAIIWALTVLFLSTFGDVTPPDLLKDVITPDKLGHAAAYCVLAFSLTWGFFKNGNTRNRAILRSVLMSIGYGVLMEIIQYSFFPNRYFEVWDIVANIIGCLVSILVSYFVIK